MLDLHPRTPFLRLTAVLSEAVQDFRHWNKSCFSEVFNANVKKGVRDAVKKSICKWCKISSIHSPLYGVCPQTRDSSRHKTTQTVVVNSASSLGKVLFQALTETGKLDKSEA